MPFLTGLTWLLGCQLVGTLLVHLTDLPVPGPVVGMLLLLLVLRLRHPSEDGSPAGRGEGSVHVAADALLAHLQLFFVPAGVGVVAYLGLLRADAVPVLAGLVGSWLAGLVAVGLLAQLLGRRSARRGQGGGAA
ncbi:CidA/LrgA family protein [Nocardioides bruguierae]|uniref:CidA/LrgA family protein n=1 Tax=Nocardioides bruguierae TaxID=2945102 RepID=A0A9X2D7R6_9ACTN|nr:CidA/LrgA family protein [Nocardioides bruguierae]MCL8024560.1 CidA/LrgA family protein [Nocardioides bruguierae]MCM0620823.1 CidA/LrgA family protein [Nocardioides bruguierae]